MPETLQIEIDDDGQIAGDLPDPIAAVLKRVEDSALSKGRGMGIEEATKNAKTQIEDAIAREKSRLEQEVPFELQRLKRLEGDHQTLSERMTEQLKESERSRKALDEQHAKDVLDRTQQLEARDARIRALTGKHVRALAVEHGARDESLDELELILSHYIGYDEAMEPFIKGPDGAPLEQQGKPVAMQAFVRSYLDQHPHHRRAVKGQPNPFGRAASLMGTQTIMDGSGSADALKRVAEGDRSVSAIQAALDSHLAKQREARK